MPKLKEWLLERFATMVFNSSGKFPAMSGPPAHIHLKEGSTPKARHNPIPVPYHYKEQVKEALWEDVKRGIISPVPIGTPTDWCSTMVITAKKNGKPRRTVDYQHLNSQCKRETHHTSSPFQLSLQVPPKTKKTVLDAVDGYHSIPSRWRISTSHDLYHRMGSFHVSQNAPRVCSFRWRLYTKVRWDN